ncbi:MAG: signal recognition particle receptor subunit alpha, partial [Sphingomonadales bacterium]
MGFFDKIFGKKEKESLDQGLQKTREGFLAKLARVVTGKSTVDADLISDLEEALIGADVGVQTTSKIIDRIEKRVAADKYMNAAELNSILKYEIEEVLINNRQSSLYDFKD